MKKYEHRAHTVALLVAVLGPLINLLTGIGVNAGPPNMYLYWAICLSIYIVIIFPFTHKRPLTFIKLLILGIVVEDFASHTWRSIFSGYKLLPFCNWYTQHFPFLGSLGDPTPFILIPQWYLIVLLIYSVLTFVQFKKPHRKLPE